MRTPRLLLRLRSGQFHRAALWAMVPLAVFNGWPVLGCLCADGSYSSNCPALRKSASQRSDDSCCCADACSAEQNSSSTPPSCCLSKADDAADSVVRKPSDGSRQVVRCSQCCHAVVQSAVLPPLPDSVQVADEYRLPALHASTFESIDFIAAAHAACRVDNDTGHPVIDLVITLGRLVI